MPILVAPPLHALYAFWRPDALSVYTFTNLINNSTPLALAAAGETLVVISRGFDLFVAGVVLLTNVLVAVYPLDGPGGAFVSPLMCCAIGAFVGLINGILVSRLGLQTIAPTLGTMIICQGLALVILDAPGGMIADFVTYTLTDTLFGVVPIAGLFLVAVVLLWLAFRRTATGTGLYAIGADEQSARFSGVAVSGVRITGLCRRRHPLRRRRLHAERSDRDRQSVGGHAVPDAHLCRGGARRHTA
ncbi:ABC transporter permease subunit [Mesorhizobium sp. CA13]|uniref:ABC transporter permease n=1 Tax=Mesorhizobium sp. CA13 TaxID=2876643 RepID=UPI002962126C|nr:hypothetical protein [Mesorhizobium sp. CA13]